MNDILVIADKDSDLLSLLKKNCRVTVKGMDSADLEGDWGALCVLCGTGEPHLPSAKLQRCIEKMRSLGKPVFCEMLTSIGAVRSRGMVGTERQRLVYFDKYLAVDGLLDGDLLDPQANECIKYRHVGEGAMPILTYQENVCAHYNLQMSEEEHREQIYALWWMDENTLVSSVRISNFHRARFAPRKKWWRLVCSLISFLAGEPLAPEPLAPVVTYSERRVECAADTFDTVRRGISWIKNAGILKNGGSDGAYEGFSNRISARDGTQTRATNVRTDCTMEIGGALLFDSLLTADAESARAADALFDFAFEFLQVKEGEHSGMLRWSEAAWETCFQDDAARAVLPLLLTQFFDTDIPHFAEIRAALDYMLKSTGADGIRIACTEICSQTPEYAASLRAESSSEPSAHFNSYYHAALLLSYRASGEERYLSFAERGLSALMAKYPNTRRETSETEECCRMVLPLAVLYGITGREEHYDWLCRVTSDLAKRRHASGGYAEWDTDYRAACSRNHRGECALLANNGDPVADLLYSNNWLPLGFAYAYLVTGERRFYELWCSHASFIASSQMHSARPELNGAWTRAFDMDEGESYGMPHDAGWGPYCIESGWTVGEILMGLQLMQLAERKHGGKNNPLSFNKSK